jgi:hypothetical protein
MAVLRREHSPTQLSTSDALVLRAAQQILAARAEEWRQRHLAADTAVESATTLGVSYDAKSASAHIDKLLAREGA